MKNVCTSNLMKKLGTFVAGFIIIYTKLLGNHGDFKVKQEF